MTKAPIGTRVYWKSEIFPTRYNRDDKPHTIAAHVRRRSGIIKAQLENGEIVSFGDLVPTPCGLCELCPYHKCETAPEKGE